jgi:sulfide:quinone oxidoreductase
MSNAATRHYRLVIVGGGTAGITVAARLVRALKQPEIAIIEPSPVHYYQPLWTLVGAGVFKKEATKRQEKDLLPHGVTWLQERVVELCPGENAVVTSDGKTITYDYLVLAAGIQIDWQKIKGLEGHLGQNGLCSNYAYDQCERTWETISTFQGGIALFTQPATPIKCGGAPQKIMYLADDAFRKAGVREQTQIRFLTGTPTLFTSPAYTPALTSVAARKDIETSFRHELIEVRPQSKEAVFINGADGSELVLHYDMLHIAPPMSAPDFIKHSPLAQTEGPQKGYVKVDKGTLQHPDFPNVFALGDASALPTSKTGAAVRKQAPVLVHNLLAMMKEEEPKRFVLYDGYTSCPLVTGYGKLILAEFDYSLQPKETFPFDQSKERLSMYLFKKYGLPVLYWKGMLKGLV